MPFLKIATTLVSEMSLEDVQKELIYLGFDENMVRNIYFCQGNWPNGRVRCIKEYKSSIKEAMRKYKEAKRTLREMDVEEGSQGSEGSENDESTFCPCCCKRDYRGELQRYNMYHSKKQKLLNDMNNAKNELIGWKNVLVVKSIDEYNIRAHGLVERMLDISLEKVKGELEEMEKVKEDPEVLEKGEDEEDK